MKTFIEALYSATTGLLFPLALAMGGIWLGYWAHDDIHSWLNPQAAICTTDTECMKLCTGEIDCDGGPQS